MKQFGTDVVKNPNFNTVTGLTNTTFDPENIVPDRGATEGQLKFLSDILVELEEAQARCCETDWDQEIIGEITQRLDELEAQINNCCNKTCYDSGSGEGEYNPNVRPTSCPGSTVTVSFGWDGPNAFMHGGTASAVSSSGAAIVGYYLLALVGASTPVKLSTSAQWSINGSGHVQWSSTASGYGVPIGIVAVDADGCEGHTFIGFPYAFVGG